jgi:hypothetical protein
MESKYYQLQFIFNHLSAKQHIPSTSAPSKNSPITLPTKLD